MRSLPAVLTGLLLSAFLVVVTLAVTFVERSPVHTDSYVGLVGIWAADLVAGAALWCGRRPSWAITWLCASVGAVVTLVWLLLGHSS